MYHKKKFSPSITDFWFQSRLKKRPPIHSKQPERLLPAKTATELFKIQKKRLIYLQNLQYCTILNGASIDKLEILKLDLNIDSSQDVAELIDNTAKKSLSKILDTYHDADLFVIFFNIGSQTVCLLLRCHRC